MSERRKKQFLLWLNEPSSLGSRSAGESSRGDGARDGVERLAGEWVKNCPAFRGLVNSLAQRELEDLDAAFELWLSSRKERPAPEARAKPSSPKAPKPR